MIIAEFAIDHPVLGESLQRIPDIQIEWEETYRRADGLTQMIFWVQSDDFDAVGPAITHDPAVENPSVLIDIGDRRLYRVDFTGLGRETNLMPEFIKTGGVLQEAIGTNDGWQCQARFPDRAAYEHIYQFCRDHDIAFRFKRLYEQPSHQREEQTSLTEAQRETLLEAVESGYLSIPRECTLAQLGERLGISQTAVSERFRRATKNLIAQTL